MPVWTLLSSVRTSKRQLLMVLIDTPLFLAAIITGAATQLLARLGSRRGLGDLDPSDRASIVIRHCHRC
jgi:hypothetical protein